MHPSEPPIKTGRSQEAAAAAATVEQAVCAIPARYASQRLPGKPLAVIAGRTMIEHVWRRASGAERISRVVVLTDDERIAKAVESFGGEVEMTPADCQSGTDRIAWAARHWSERVIVNVQGDEPLLDPALVTRIAAFLLDHSEAEMVTAATAAADKELGDPDKVKVVCDRSGRALYFSRAGIPYPRNPTNRPQRHIGIYGYTRAVLLRLAALAPTPLELCESLEQLRALEHGIGIQVLSAARAPIGVDTAEDLERVEQLLETTATMTAKA